MPNGIEVMEQTSGGAPPSAGHDRRRGIDRRSGVTDAERWRTLRTLLDTGGPWALVGPTGVVEFASDQLIGAVGRGEAPALDDVVSQQHRPELLEAIGTTSRGGGPLRLDLDQPVPLGVRLVTVAFVCAKMPFQHDGQRPVIIQFVVRPVQDDDRVIELEAALRRVGALASQTVSQTGEGPSDGHVVAAPLPTTLTARRRDIATDVLCGLTVRQIAAKRGISTHTVRNHLKAVYRQLGVRSLSDLQRRYHA